MIKINLFSEFKKYWEYRIYGNRIWILILFLQIEIQGFYQRILDLIMESVVIPVDFIQLNIYLL